MQQGSRLSKANAYGGGRQAIMDSELIRNLQSNLANITGQGYNTAYDKGASQFNTEQQRGMASQQMANQYGLDVAARQANLGQQQRGIEQQGITADLAQFEQERDDPYKKVQYQQSLLQGLPIETQSRTYAEPSGLASFLGNSGGILQFLQDAGLLTGST